MIMVVLVLGKNGQLGQAFQEISKTTDNFKWIFLDRASLDLNNDNIQSVLEQYEFDIVVNCAAYTAVDLAETERDLCYKVNVEAVDTISKFCCRNNKILVHFSSDYVYHNDINRPMMEGDPTTPKGVYAKSKLASEQIIINNSPASIIIRTSWLYNAAGKNFVNTMIRLAETRPDIKVVDDQIGTPTYVPHLAQAVISIIENKQFISRIIQLKRPEIFNFSNEGVCSWYDFACAIFEITSSQVKCTPIPSSEYPTPARRPPYSVLNKKRIKSLIGIDIPHWREGLKKCLNQKQH